MVQGRLVGADVGVNSVSTDTRTLSAGQLFIALRGPRFDGHDCIKRNPDLPAAALMVSRQLNTPLPQVLVDDTQLALSRLAEAWRERLDLVVIGLTGSNGKTTVKEMIAAIMARKGNVFATPGNLNNHIGVPLTLLSIRSQHEFAVVEMGANHPGEIGGLVDIVQPRIALITNAGPAHLEGFGSLDGVAQAKAEIFNGLNDQGIAIINADDIYADYWHHQARRLRRLSFGLDHPADISGSWRRGGSLNLVTTLGSVDISLPLQGRHNAMNAMAASTAAIAAGAGVEHIKAGLETMHPVNGRLVPKTGIKQAMILDDSYNANPGSFDVALDVLSECSGERWLVLGDMVELGEFAELLHRQVGERARARGIARIYAIGSLTKLAVTAFGEDAMHFENVDALLRHLKADLHDGVYVLVKGSRAMHMDKVVASLLATASAKQSAGGKEHAA
ncbi:MAG: UDP-N-acetylmuramoyl-tripeptide--D-alanyl-D-alanine ligase [Gammaproteobacteria bacterium]|nr:UDP-N-acetylmuramoyl-tripeptide--D-alanyl-D-alanine ligase [Gammaproteobacteria bacterium]